MSATPNRQPALATGDHWTPSHSPARFEAANSRGATPIPSASKRGSIILGSGRGRKATGVVGRSKLRFDSSFSVPGTPSRHSTDGSAAMTDTSRAGSHAGHLAAELANATQVVFAQSDEMTVTFCEDLPTEVRGVIGRGGTYASFWEEMRGKKKRKKKKKSKDTQLTSPLQTRGTTHILVVMIIQPAMLGPAIVIPASCGSTT